MKLSKKRLSKYLLLLALDLLCNSARIGCMILLSLVAGFSFMLTFGCLGFLLSIVVARSEYILYGSWNVKHYIQPFYKEFCLFIRNNVYSITPITLGLGFAAFMVLGFLVLELSWYVNTELSKICPSVSWWPGLRSDCDFKKTQRLEAEVKRNELIFYVCNDKCGKIYRFAAKWLLNKFDCNLNVFSGLISQNEKESILMQAIKWRSRCGVVQALQCAIGRDLKSGVVLEFLVSSCNNGFIGVDDRYEEDEYKKMDRQTLIFLTDIMPILFKCKIIPTLSEIKLLPIWINCSDKTKEFIEIQQIAASYLPTLKANILHNLLIENPEKKSVKLCERQQVNALILSDASGASLRANEANRLIDNRRVRALSC